MNRLYFDIETIPDQTPGAINKFLEQEPLIDAGKFTIDQLCIDLKKDRDPLIKYKKPELIEEWQSTIGEQKRLEKAQENYRKTALSGSYGQILVIGYSLGGGEISSFHGEEKALLENFNNTVLEHMKRYHVDKSVIQFVGHNVLDFDIKFLFQRMVINGIKPFFNFPIYKYGSQVFDTMSVWTGYERIKLDELCKVLGVQSPKNGIDGSKVYDYFLEGRIDEIADYCKADVRAVIDIYNKLTFKKETA